MASKAKTIRIKPAPAGWNLAAMLIAILVCAVLGVAAYSKIVDPNKAKFIVLGGSEFRYERAIGIFEVLVIIALLAGHRLRLAWLGVLALFALFAGYAGYYFASGESCGCFGNALDGTPFEWMTIKGVSVAFDLLFVLAALALLAWRGFSGKTITGLVGAAMVLSVGGAWLGSVEYAEYEKMREKAKETSSDPVEDEELAPGLRVGHHAAKLMRQDEFADIIGDETEGRMWYIFVYDPDCSECMEMKPLVDMFQQQYADEESPYMQVRSVTKQHAEQYGIEFWAWPSGATMIIVQDGDIVKVYDEDLTPGEKPLPDQLMEGFFAGEDIGSNWPPAE